MSGGMAASPSKISYEGLQLYCHFLNTLQSQQLNILMTDHNFRFSLMTTFDAYTSWWNSNIWGMGVCTDMLGIVWSIFSYNKQITDAIHWHKQTTFI